MDTELIEAIKTITPEMYRQAIMWGWVCNFTLIAFGLTFAMLLVWGYRKLRPKMDGDDLFLLRMISGGVVAIIVVLLMCGIFECIKLIVAPYSYILSQIGGS